MSKLNKESQKILKEYKEMYLKQRICFHNRRFDNNALAISLNKSSAGYQVKADAMQVETGRAMPRSDLLALEEEFVEANKKYLEVIHKTINRRVKSA